MRRKQRLPELLAPAGDFECLLAAVEGGADAVYVGGRRFGARAYAKNFDIEQLSAAVNYCHLHGVKLYAAVNTLCEDRELCEAVEYAEELWRIGVDALIVADIGLAAQLKIRVPEIELHASTQMSIHNLYGAEVASELGFSRVVPARELPYTEICSIVDRAAAEVEVFLHGALCVCYSGQCLFSSLVGGRSGNRGECAQPCRLPYNGGYPISLKDLSLAEHIPELIESGVSSLKIEGRMKSPDYVYMVTSIYRRLLDEQRVATREENEALRRAFSRGGFTDGYFIGRKQSNMTGVRSEADKLDSRLESGRVFAPRRVSVRATVELRLGKPAKMTLTDGQKSITVTTRSPEAAKNAPLVESAVKERLSKMGNTYLSLRPEDIELFLDEGINLAPSAVNELRRCAAHAFESAERWEKTELSYPHAVAAERKVASPKITAQFFSGASFSEAMRRCPKRIKKIDIAFLPIGSDEDSISRARGVAIPPVVFDSEIEKVKTQLKRAKKAGALYALVDNIGHIGLAREAELVPFGGFRLNITNAFSAEAYRRMGVSDFLAGAELTLPRAADVGGGVIVYGRIPLMLTERCFIKGAVGCDSCSDFVLKDRRAESFPVIREWEHRNLILNSSITYMGDKKNELARYGINIRHFLFTVESAEQIDSVLLAYERGDSLGLPVRRVGRRDN